MTASIWNPEALVLGVLGNNTDPTKGSYLIGHLSAATGAVGTNARAKLNEIVSVRDFGDAGSGSNDSAIAQLALDSGAKVVVFPFGRTYLLSGLTATTNGQRIVCHGATLKLLDNAASKDILHVTGTDCVIEGGNWDGNKANGNAPVDTYESYAVGLYGDRCTMRDARIYDFHGIGIKGFGNYLLAEHNNISGTTHYGIFFDGNTLVSHTGNKAIDNVIDMSAGGSIGQGILFTAGTGQNQIDWELRGNKITGPSDSGIADQAINLAVRGHSGIVIGNQTRYGSMGFSEGGDNCIITDNLFLQLRGTVRIGTEPSGRCTVKGNTITDAYVGVDCTAANSDFDRSLVANNTITAVSGGGLSIGIRFQIASTKTGRVLTIANNDIVTNVHGIYLKGEVSAVSIKDNTFVGPGIGAGRGVYLDTVNTATPNIDITDNTFIDFLRPWSVYSLGALTYTDLRATHNTTINCGATSTTWPVEGAATIGARCSVIGADNKSLDVQDVAANVFTMRSATYSNPEGVLTAGIGSVHISLNSTGGVYYKSTGTGNTGWVAL